LFDTTFLIVPVPFYQCLIVMVFDASLKIYVPVAWILMSGHDIAERGDAIRTSVRSVDNADSLCEAGISPISNDE
jgi:hypothetical protein